jgi:predicted O-methyltransferase YrrM
MKKYAEIMHSVKKQISYPKVAAGINGMLSRPEAHWLLRIPMVIGDGIYVELGTYRGRSATFLAYTIKTEKLNAKVITVDAFDDRRVSRRFKGDGTIVTSGPRWPEGAGNDLLGHVTQTFKNVGLLDYIQPVKSTTVEAASLFPDLKCKFLFIDADHSYEAVKADFNAWKDKVLPEGIIAFHDSHRADIIRVHSEIKDWKEFDRVDTLSVWRRV